MKALQNSSQTFLLFLVGFFCLSFLTSCSAGTAVETAASQITPPETLTNNESVVTTRATVTVVPSKTPTITPTFTPSSTPTATATATPSPTPTATVLPSPTATAVALTPSEIFQQISPSIFFVDATTKTGSGVLLDGGYILTNAHVVWPYAEVRIVSGAGSEYTQVPVFETDLAADLALLGPIDNDASPMTLADGEDNIIGSTLYLIGYPGEVEKFPQPTITQGILSRMRQWEDQQISYFQTDATITGGQSGGVLVSDRGDVIGISGRSFSAGEFGLVASAIDLQPRVEGLLVGENIDKLRGRWPEYDRMKLENFSNYIDNPWVPTMFFLREPVGTDVEIEVDGDANLVSMVLDSNGNIVTLSDEAFDDAGSVNFTTQTDSPYFLLIYTDFAQYFKLHSNIGLVEYHDADDSHTVNNGHVVTGNIDYPGDIDYFQMTLEKDQTVHVKVDSTMIDPLLSITYDTPEQGQSVKDDDSGGGMLGTNAELTYKAPEKRSYYFNVQATDLHTFGGYTLYVDEPGAAAPTPMAPLPTPTPLTTDLGEMREFSSEDGTFTVEYPATLTNASKIDRFGWGPCVHDACYADPQLYLFIFKEDITHLGDISLIELGDAVSDFYAEDPHTQIHDFSLIDTAAGKALVTRATFDDGAFWEQHFTFLQGESVINMYYIYADVGFTVTDLQLFPDLRELAERDLDAIIAHSFESFALKE